MRQLHPEAIAAIQSKALFSKAEEQLLSKVGSVRLRSGKAEGRAGPEPALMQNCFEETPLPGIAPCRCAHTCRALVDRILKRAEPGSLGGPNYRFLQLRLGTGAGGTDGKPEA